MKVGSSSVTGIAPAELSILNRPATCARSSTPGVIGTPTGMTSWDTSWERQTTSRCSSERSEKVCCTHLPTKSCEYGRRRLPKCGTTKSNGYMYGSHKLWRRSCMVAFTGTERTTATRGNIEDADLRSLRSKKNTKDLARLLICRTWLTTPISFSFRRLTQLFS